MIELPPLHPRCRCVIIYREIEGSVLRSAPNNGKMNSMNNDIEFMRRKKGADGHEIIDQPTYNKLTKSFIKAGGIIIRGEEAAQHLKKAGAYASYIVGMDVAFIADDATVSDVLEEMYHAKQDRAKMFGEVTDLTVLLKREIDAQKYLLRIADKYKIPPEEVEITKQNLEQYEKQLAEREVEEND